MHALKYRLSEPDKMEVKYIKDKKCLNDLFKTGVIDEDGEMMRNLNLNLDQKTINFMTIILSKSIIYDPCFILNFLFSMKNVANSINLKLILYGGLKILSNKSFEFTCNIKF